MYFYAVLSSLPFSRHTNDEEQEESAQKQATAMIKELQTKGMMQTIITQACSDFGRRGARGLKALVSLNNATSLTKSVNAQINAAEKVAIVLQQELTRCFSEHLHWNRMGRPSVKTTANRVTYITGEILHQFEKPIFCLFSFASIG